MQIELLFIEVQQLIRNIVAARKNHRMFRLTFLIPETLEQWDYHILSDREKVGTLPYLAELLLEVFAAPQSRVTISRSVANSGSYSFSAIDKFGASRVILISRLANSFSNA